MCRPDVQTRCCGEAVGEESTLAGLLVPWAPQSPARGKQSSFPGRLGPAGWDGRMLGSLGHLVSQDQRGWRREAGSALDSRSYLRGSP